MIYIYALECPIENCVRYVGKTKNIKTRLASHLSKSTAQLDHHCARWIRRLRAQGLKPKLEILHIIADDDDWQAAETKCIAEHRAAGHPLTNMTAGGDGFHNVHPDVLKRRVESRTQTLQDPIKRAEFVDRMNASRNRPEVRAAQSLGLRNAWADTEKRRRLLEGAHDPAVLKRRSEISIKMNADPAFKAKLIVILKRIWSTPERRAEAKARAAAMHANPEQSARRRAAITAAYQKSEVKANLAAAMVEVRKRPSFTANKSAASKAAWTDPAYREKLKNSPHKHERMSAAAKARLADPAGREAFMKVMNDPARVAKISAAISIRNSGDFKLHAKVKANWADPEHRAKRLDAMAATKSDPDWRRKFSASVAQSWADPLIREKRGALQRAPEVRAKRSASIKEWWARRKLAAQQQPIVVDG